MGEDPRAIRAEIEETRERMGDTVDALAYKADVKTRAKESVSDKVDTIKSKVTGTKDSVTESVAGARDSMSDATPSTGDVKHQAKRTVGMAQENPLGLAIGATAVGFIAGMLIPSTRVEDEKIGPASDQVKEKAAEVGQQALDRGKQVAQDVAQQASETAKESGREHAQGMTDDARQAAQDTREQVSSS
jgi:phage tail protein X